MLSLLVRKQLTEIFRNYFYNPKKNTARSRGAVVVMLALFVLLMVVILGGMFAFFSVLVCDTLIAAGLDWLYFTLFSMVAVLLGTFGSVFNTYAGLYLSKDNDLLLSMPIPVRCIISARLLGVYLMGLMYSGVVIVPAIIVYWVVAPFSAGVLVGSVLLVLLLSLFVLVLSCLLGWVVAKISLKLKNKSFVTVFISLLCFGAYYFFYFKAQALLGELIENAVYYGSVIKDAAYPLYLLGRVAAGDWLAMLLVGAAVAVLFALTWLLLSHSFLKIATATGKVTRVAYKEGKTQLRSPSRALFAKELRRFTASPNYMLNCGLSTLMLPLAGIALLFKGAELTNTLGLVFAARPGAVTALLCAVICMLIAMNDTAAPSISLEGKALWQLQSLPVRPWHVLRAKLAVQLAITMLPALFCSVCAALACRLPAVDTVLVLVLPQLCALFLACLDLSIGVKRPNLNWTSEIVPIKQGLGVFLALITGWVYGLLLGGGYLLVGYKLGLLPFLGLFALLTLLAAVLLLTWLKRRGTKIFAAL